MPGNPMPPSEPLAPGLPLKALLDEAGLNRQHAFDVEQLPDDVRAPLGLQAHERQLILLAHAGRRLWERVQAAGAAGEHPIDDYSVDIARRWLAGATPGARHRIVYPKGQPGGLPPRQHVGLQRLGSLAGWHHPSPFMVGIDSQWGSWFAYRVAILADTSLPLSAVEDTGHPCPNCRDTPCIRACPAGALDRGVMDAQACRDYRLRESSPCALGCIARLACPVGAEHRYEQDQIRHSSAGSLRAIRLLAAATDESSVRPTS